VRACCSRIEPRAVVDDEQPLRLPQPQSLHAVLPPSSVHATYSGASPPVSSFLAAVVDLEMPGTRPELYSAVAASEDGW